MSVNPSSYFYAVCAFSYLTDMITLFLFFCFAFVPDQAMFRGHPWLCSESAPDAVLRESRGGQNQTWALSHEVHALSMITLFHLEGCNGNILVSAYMMKKNSLVT